MDGANPESVWSKLDPGFVRDLVTTIFLMGYDGQVFVEELFHASTSPEAATEFATKLQRRKSGLERWFKHRKGRRTLIGWGGAAEEVVHPTTTAVTQALADLAVPGGYDILHGSSHTGNMGVLDRAWNTAISKRSPKATLDDQDDDRGQVAEIGMIPLKWFGPTRECRATNGTADMTSPPQALLSLRGDLFGLGGDIRGIVLLPCGLGGLAEISHALMWLQLSAQLLTPFSHLRPEELPNMWVIDRPRQNSSGWYFEGFQAQLDCFYDESAMRANTVGKLTIIRIGDGEAVCDSRRVSVRYFPTPEAAAEFMISQASSVGSPEPALATTTV